METSRGARLASQLLKAFTAMSAEVTDDLADRGNPGATPALHFAMEAIEHGASDASALGRALGISRQAAAKTIRSLEDLGYVDRGIDEGDARRRPLRVTDRGRDWTALGAAAFERILERLEASEGAEHVAVLEQLLERIPEITSPGADGPLP
ncbi:winged helix-turn-helix transcriptional regulator [Curtobacterium sp. VKM Ac-2865]|uniref:MarR family winged helix-turn-helix transcriptional regulator n=1 Tax=Curtobacterium sp. VKM Ac-2865 TaxID=2783817 RepID=UPI00188CD316|nr:MarR family winged helix-turn-helix transcriptional regulator [Curtobacterium sp. VKM Ac-2865]MBF4583756.1 winged helix-turn-helix transcriptional regulator [Curtobacterium sp. VKM Ac-2865]